MEMRTVVPSGRSASGVIKPVCPKFLIYHWHAFFVFLAPSEKCTKGRDYSKGPKQCPLASWGNATLLLNRTLGAPERFRPSKGIIEERLMIFLMSPVSLETFKN